MIRLIEPKKDDDITADFMREIVRAIRMVTPVAGVGLKATETINGTVLNLIDLGKRPLSPVVYPRAFDIKSISAGVITLMNCSWQIGSQYFSSDAEPAVNAATGTVCAIINKQTQAVTAGINTVWSELTPELIPLALYKIDLTDGNVTVLRDVRGTTISLHE